MSTFIALCCSAAIALCYLDAAAIVMFRSGAKISRVRGRKVSIPHARAAHHKNNTYGFDKVRDVTHCFAKQGVTLFILCINFHYLALSKSS